MNRFHPWLFLIVTLFLWTSGIPHADAAPKDAAAGLGAAQAAEPGAPSIEVSDPVFDFGEVMEGSEVTHEFLVRNDGKGTLRIEQVRPSCGCTAAHYDRTVPAGGTGKVTLRLDTRGYEGKLKKTATVLSNDPREPRLILTLQGAVKTLHMYAQGALAVAVFKRDMVARARYSHIPGFAGGGQRGFSHGQQAHKGAGLFLPGGKVNQGYAVQPHIGIVRDGQRKGGGPVHNAVIIPFLNAQLARAYGGAVVPANQLRRVPGLRQASVGA